LVRHVRASSLRVSIDHEKRNSRVVLVFKNCGDALHELRDPKNFEASDGASRDALSITTTAAASWWAGGA
jgi:hypothetical protein